MKRIHMETNTVNVQLKIIQSVYNIGHSVYGIIYIITCIQFNNLFIYCHLYSAFSIVQCSNVLYRL